MDEEFAVPGGVWIGIRKTKFIFEGVDAEAVIVITVSQCGTNEFILHRFIGIKKRQRNGQNQPGYSHSLCIHVFCVLIVGFERFDFRPETVLRGGGGGN